MEEQVEQVHAWAEKPRQMIVLAAKPGEKLAVSLLANVGRIADHGGRPTLEVRPSGVARQAIAHEDAVLGCIALPCAQSLRDHVDRRSHGEQRVLFDADHANVGVTSNHGGEQRARSGGQIDDGLSRVGLDGNCKRVGQRLRRQVDAVLAPKTVVQGPLDGLDRPPLGRLDAIETHTCQPCVDDFGVDHRDKETANPISAKLSFSAEEVSPSQSSQMLDGLRGHL
jgi:hypothetical protein